MSNLPDADQFNKEKFIQWVQNCKKHIEINPSMNEPNTKSKLIEPLLEILGWDHFDRELEYSIRVGSTTAKVDYALMLDNKPVILVEAKGFDTDIGPSQAEQVITYGRIEPVRWVIITNGKDMRILNSEQGKSYDQCLFKKLTIDDYLNNIPIIELLSKMSMKSGLLDQTYKDERKFHDYVRSFNSQKNVIKKQISDLLKNGADKELLPAIEVAVDEMVDEFPSKIIRSKETSTIQIISPIATKSVTYGPNLSMNDLKTISRTALPGNDDDEVVLFSSRESGIDFLLKYNVWGYINIRHKPKYFAMYVGAPYSGVLFFGEIEKISDDLQNLNDYQFIDEKDRVGFSPGTQIVSLKKGSLMKIKDPIPFESPGMPPRALRYPKIGDIRHAKNTNDL
jgi:predicted type IV restriction endonuclease